MNKICIATIVLAMAFLASCGGSKESKTVEQQVETTDSVVDETVFVVTPVKSIEVLYNGKHSNTLNLKYDDQNRLIETIDEFSRSNKITYSDTEVKIINEDLNPDGTYSLVKTFTYKYSDGKPTECNLEMGQSGRVNKKYSFDGDKISGIENVFNGEVSKYAYKWDNGCMTEQIINYHADNNPQKTTFEYTDMRNPFNVDIISFVTPEIDILAFDKGCISDFLPSKSVFTWTSNDNIKETQRTAFEYNIDDATGKITSININRTVITDELGTINEETTIITLNLTY